MEMAKLWDIQGVTATNNHNHNPSWEEFKVYQLFQNGMHVRRYREIEQNAATPTANVRVLGAAAAQLASRVPASVWQQLAAWRKTNVMTLNKELLISTVKQYPVLYDSTDAGYKQIKSKNKIWDEVAAIVGETDGK